MIPTALFAQGQKATDEPTVFKYGFLSSMSGNFAAISETQRKSFLLAVEEKNATGGLNMPWGKVPIETMVKDDEAKLDVGVRRYRELKDAGINALTGGIWNPMSSALNEQSKIDPIIYIPSYVPAIGIFQSEEYADCTFSPTYTPWTIGYIIGMSAVQEIGAKSIFFLERSDSWGETMRQGLEAALAKYGGKIVGTAILPSGTVDYSPIITEAMRLKADIFVTTMFGGDAIANIKQAYDLGLHNQMDIMAAWAANIVYQGIPEGALKNHYTLAWFYWDMEGFEDEEIVASVKSYTDAYQKRWNEVPDNMGSGTYVASQIIFEAVERAGTFNPEKVAAVIASEEFDTVLGKYYYRPDHQPILKHSAFLLKGKAPEERTGKYDFFHVVRSFGGEEVLPPLSMMGF